MEEQPDPVENNPSATAINPDAPVEVSSKAKPQKFSLRKFNKRLSLIISVLLKIGGLMVVVLLVVVVYKDVAFKGYSLQEIHVPDRFTKDGHTGQAMAASVETELQKIRTRVETYDQWDINDGVEAGDYSVADNGSELDVNLVGVGFSIRSIVNLVRTSLGIEKNRTVTAYITLDYPNVTLTTYIKGQPAQQVTIPVDSGGYGATVKSLSLAAAESILKVSNPELLATYLSIGNRSPTDLDKIISVCNYALLNNSDTLRRRNYYTMLGWAQLDKRNFPEGVASIKKALAIDPTFLSGHFGLAVGLSRMGKREASRTSYRNGLRVAEARNFQKDKIFFYRDQFHRNMMSSYWSSNMIDSAMLMQNKYISFLLSMGGGRPLANGYNEIAFIFSERGLYDSALVNVGKAVAIDSSLAIAYTTLAEIHGYLKEKEKFYFYLKKAFDKGYVMPSQVEFISPYSTYRNEKEFRALWDEYTR
jgi:tetratricopeptide (TPR) repeat protein